MYKLFIILNIFSTLLWEFTKIAQMNSLKEEAEKFYLEGKFNDAIKNYNKLLFNYKLKDDKAILNLAHSLYHNKSYSLANKYYKKLENCENNKIKSIANLQLGIISSKKSQKKALVYFENALKADPQNEIARYNYELLKKFLQAHQGNARNKQKKSGQAKGYDKSGKGNQNSIEGQGFYVPIPSSKEKKPKSANPSSTRNEQSPHSDLNPKEENHSTEKPFSEGIENNKSLNEAGTKNSQALLSNRLKEINLSLEKAKLIMETFEKQEIQYIQQLKKKKTVTSEDKDNNDINKPDY